MMENILKSAALHRKNSMELLERLTEKYPYAQIIPPVSKDDDEDWFEENQYVAHLVRKDLISTYQDLPSCIELASKISRTMYTCLKFKKSKHHFDNRMKIDTLGLRVDGDTSPIHTLESFKQSPTGDPILFNSSWHYGKDRRSEFMGILANKDVVPEQVHKFVDIIKEAFKTYNLIQADDNRLTLRMGETSIDIGRKNNYLQAYFTPSSNIDGNDEESLYRALVNCRITSDLKSFEIFASKWGLIEEFLQQRNDTMKRIYDQYVKTDAMVTEATNSYEFIRSLDKRK